MYSWKASKTQKLKHTSIDKNQFNEANQAARCGQWQESGPNTSPQALLYSTSLNLALPDLHPAASSTPLLGKACKALSTRSHPACMATEVAGERKSSTALKKVGGEERNQKVVWALRTENQDECS